MDISKTLSSSKKDKENETLNYSLSSIHLHINSNEFEKNIYCDAFIKDKEHLHIEYNFVKKIGEGTFGVVVLAIHKKTNEKVAIKILEKQKIIDDIDMIRIKKEIEILKQLRHNNIVQLYNVIETISHIYLIMEYINGTELFDYIINNKRINEIESCHFYQQIISGIEYLGKLNITHRDIKPENLIIDNNKRIKIVDFGLSNNYKNNQLLTTACGSTFYAAPEMVKGDNYNGIKIDIWSSGIVLYAMLCGFLPFEDKDNDILYRKIIDGNFEIPSFLSEEAINIISHILVVDPNKRYNINDIKKHPWFNKVNPKINMTEGLLLNKYVIPYDEKVITYMSNKFNIKINDIKYDILLNKYNQITTLYYLLLNKKIRNNEETIGNMSSNIFIEYIHNKKNLLSYYDYNINNIINERINKNDINNNNSKLIKKHTKIIRSSDNYNKTKKILTIGNIKIKNRNDLLLKIININNIKNVISNVKKKQIIKDVNKTITLNRSQDIYKDYEKQKSFNNSDMKTNAFKSVFNKDKNNDINNDYLKNKIESINLSLKNNMRFKSFENNKNNNNNKQKTFINIVNPKNFFLINKNEKNIFLNKQTNLNKENDDYIINQCNEYKTYNNTMRNSHINSPKIKEIFITKNQKKTKKEVLSSYKKKKVLSFSFQKTPNVINNEIDLLSNNLIMNSNKKENNNINYIQIMNIPEGNNFFSNNFNPKSKLYTYKKIKIPKISKKLNHSGKTESVNSSKCEEKSSNPSFNNTFDNFNKIMINNYNKKDKNNNCLNTLNKEKNIEDDIFLHNPIIEHIYDRNNKNDMIREKEAKTSTIINNNNTNDNKNIQFNFLNNNYTDDIKDKNIFANKIKKIYKKANNNREGTKNNKFITLNNLSNNLNPKKNNLNYNIIDNSCNINNNYSAIYYKNDFIQKKNTKDSSLNDNIPLFKKPKINNNNLNNIHTKSGIINNNQTPINNNDKDKNKDILREKNSNKKTNILNSYKCFQNYNKNNYSPFDLHSLLYYDKENRNKRIIN